MRILVILLALVLAGSLAAPASAAPWLEVGDGDIEVLEQGAESEFPNGIRFFVRASSPDEINDIRVFFRIIGRATGSAYRVMEFERGQEVEAELLLRSGGGDGYMPPGTEIEYSFEIWDRTDRVHRTPVQSFIYLDTRFEWDTLSSGLITVYYYGRDGEERAPVVLDSAAQSLELMRPVLGIEPTEPLRIVTYNSYQEMAVALPFRSQTVSEQLITQGMAFDDERVLLVYGADPTVRGTTSHEFTHLLVAEAAGRARSFVPAWLNEGLAEFGNIAPDTSYDNALEYAIRNQRVRPLWHLATFGGTPDDIIIAYGQGRSAVRYMIDTYGADKMSELFVALQETRNIDRALEQVYGFDQYGLDSEWRVFLGLEPLPMPEWTVPQAQDTRTPPAPTPTPPAEPTLEPDPTPVAGPTPASPVQQDERPPSPGGCMAPIAGYAGGVSVELASLALWGGLAGMLGFGVLRRRKTSTGARVESVRHRVAQQIEGEE